MKPKTKLQQEVWGLHQKLSMPKEHEPFVISNHNFYYTTHYKSLICMECNHVWKPNKIWHEQVAGVECPECNKKLKKIETANGGMATRVIAYSVVQVVDRFQVVRYFSCWKHMFKNKKPRYSFRALFEEWKDWDKNKWVILGRTQSNYGDGFSSSEYEIRGYGLASWKHNPYRGFASDIVCPGAQVLPQFEKFGLTKHKHNCDYRRLINTLQDSTQAETLFKAKQFSLLNKCPDYSGTITRYWPSIKICLRNRYLVKDASIWLDYLDLLRYFNRDLHNAKFVCPKNLHKEHDRLVAKKREIQRKQDLEKKRLKVEKAQKDFEEKIQKFLGLQFSEGDITVKVLETVQEFMEEGDELKHCLFANDYHAKKDSLILSARISGKPIETIEVSLKEMKVVQSRGLQNKVTVHHDKIVEIVKRNMKHIESIVRHKKRTIIKPKTLQYASA